MQRHIPSTLALLLLLLLWLSACTLSQPNSLPSAAPTRISVTDLVAILNNPDSQGRDLADAAAEIQHWGAAAAPAVPGLRRALRYHNSYDARSTAAQALVAIGPSAQEAIPDLIQALDDESPINAYAALALGSIGQTARCAVPRLALALASKDSALRSGAAIALDALTNNDLVDSVDRKAISAARDQITIFDDDPEGTVSGQARRWWEQEGKQHEWGTKPCTL